MDDSFHYLSMINHMTVQKKLMEQLADTGLTLAKSIGLLERSRWCQPERNCGRMPHRGRILNVYFEPHGRKRPDDVTVFEQEYLAQMYMVK